MKNKGKICTSDMYSVPSPYATIKCAKCFHLFEYNRMNITQNGPFILPMLFCYILFMTPHQ